jgi:hypothetical protein
MSLLFSEVNNDEKNVISVDLGKQKRWELLQVFNAIFVMPAGKVFVQCLKIPWIRVYKNQRRIDNLFKQQP